MKICLSIGYPIKSSRSPSIHNAGYKSLGIDDEFIYLRAGVKPEFLKMAIDGVRALGIRGVSVTMPHKQTVMKYLDKVDKTAQEIGAVNTIVNNNGKLTGYNTDWIGAVTALQKKINLKGKKVAVIGAGGAARAIIFGLKEKSARITIFNRNFDNAKKLASEFKCEYADLKSQELISEMDIIINATSLGMNEDKSPLDKKFISKNQVIFDIVYFAKQNSPTVYSPKETKLIRNAKLKGATIIYGYEMLLYQGVAQFELYTGMKAPVEAMRKELEKSLK